MTIASIADYRTSLRERPMWYKSAARAAPVAVTNNVSNWSTLWDGTGTPGAATLAVGNTTSGVVPTVSTTGAPPITFASGVGYLTEIEAMGMSIPGAAGQGGCRLRIYDRLFHSGAHAFNAADTLSAQPSYSTRVPGGVYVGLGIWIEVVTSFTGTCTIEVHYTNQAGTAAHTTGAFAPFSAYGVTAPVVGSMAQLPLASGDSGVQKIESVTGTIATAGTFNIVVMRQLWDGWINQAFLWDLHSNNEAFPLSRHWMDRTGMPQIFNNACLVAMYRNNGLINGSAPTMRFDIDAEIASK